MSRLLLLALASLSACSFLETAGDLEFGEGTIPVVEFNQPWPSLDQLIGTSITNPTGGALPGAPTSLNAATLAHVQGLMTIDGECRRTYDQPVIVPAQVNGKPAATTAALVRCRLPLERRWVSRSLVSTFTPALTSAIFWFTTSL